ncbi:MAG: magnesium and cobalt transport protein CorA [Alphaproteobacteria bacterium]|nr:magnesium and cobalt transport protein CorA [Alphaproteobacteria bacterium]MBU2270721.1 magnesium and cobalt transport protein CorA [Alphaproteobacteria bacterium]MBU2417935.1 magnesium and cobalt transport protein CorA [Alphaproteobacteria bacterium]
MSIVAAWLYQQGRRVRPVTIDEQVDCPEDKSQFVWIGLVDPTPEELGALQQSYGLHPLAVEDALKGEQLPKLDIFGDQLFVVARTAWLEDGDIRYGETAIFVGHSHLISVRRTSGRGHAALRAQLEASPGLLSHGVDYVLHAILDFIVDGYLPLGEALEDEVLAMERRAVDSFLARGEINRIFEIRRQLIRFQRVLAPTSDVVAKFTRLELPGIDPETRPYFSDVLDHVRRVQTMVDGLRDVLSSVFEFSNLLEQQRTGAITRQLAAWAAILAVPTAIAGIYGMNFAHMPELDSPWGYPVVMAVIVGACAALYVRFKRARWL